MRFCALLHAVTSWLNRCGESCCVGRSQIALAETLEQDRLRSAR